MIGQELKNLRQKLSITPLEIFKTHGGYTENYINNIETGTQKIINKKELRRYIDALNLTKLIKDYKENKCLSNIKNI